MAAKFTVLPKAPSLRELAHEVRLKEYFSYGLLPSSPDGLATSLMEGGFVRAAKLLARVQSLRARLLPCGELPQQRLRGLEIGVTQKIL